jgi:hypothetical protein
MAAAAEFTRSWNCAASGPRQADRLGSLCKCRGHWRLSGLGRGVFQTLGHYGTLGIEDVIVTFSYPDCLSSSALASASFSVLQLSP